MEKVETVLNRLKIDKVIWIDDIFEEPGLLSDDELAAFLQTKESAVTLCERASLSSDFVALVRELGTSENSSGLYLQELQTEPEEAKLALSRLVQATLDVSELSKPKQEKLFTIFGARLIKCSFTEWPDRSKKLMSENAIFLVDLKNGAGANGLSGKDILQQLISNEFTGLVTMFTQDCDQDGEVNLLEEIRKELDAQTADSHQKLALLRIGVISKQRFHTEEIENLEKELITPFHRLAMTSTFNQLAAQVSKSLETGIHRGITILSQLPITDIDRVVFQNSMREGCSEIELIERLLSLTQREAVATMLKGTSDLNNLLAKARDSWVSSEGIDTSKAISEGLVALRTLEIFDADELINKTHSPLSNGDIFEYREGEKIRQYVLLMSPCDSMVRNDGKRQLDTGIFVSFLEIDKICEEVKSHDCVTGEATAAAITTEPEQASSSDVKPGHDEFDTRLRYYSIPVNLGKIHKLDFMESCPVVLDSLEWCVFNPDGQVRYNKSIEPNLSLLKGWDKRLKKLKNDTKINKCNDSNVIAWPHRFLALKTNGFSHIHIASVEKDSSGQIKRGHIYFNLRRVKRLRSPYADAALSAFLNYAGRPAFEHEFLR